MSTKTFYGIVVIMIHIKIKCKNNKLSTKQSKLNRHLEKRQHNTYGKYVINVSSNRNN